MYFYKVNFIPLYQTLSKHVVLQTSGANFAFALVCLSKSEIGIILLVPILSWFHMEDFLLGSGHHKELLLKTGILVSMFISHARH